jgi:hypothetical protein
MGIAAMFVRLGDLQGTEATHGIDSTYSVNDRGGDDLGPV